MADIDVCLEQTRNLWPVATGPNKDAREAAVLVLASFAPLLAAEVTRLRAEVAAERARNDALEAELQSAVTRGRELVQEAEVALDTAEKQLAASLDTVQGECDRNLEAWEQTIASLVALRTERDAALRELERWRHGQTIEGDFVCPDSLRADEAVKVLRSVEWSGTRFGVACCPECGGYHPHIHAEPYAVGHRPGCALAAGLRGKP